MGTGGNGITVVLRPAHHLDIRLTRHHLMLNDEAYSARPWYGGRHRGVLDVKVDAISRAGFRDGQLVPPPSIRMRPSG